MPRQLDEDRVRVPRAIGPRPRRPRARGQASGPAPRRGRGHGRRVLRRRDGSRRTWSSSPPGFGRATSWPGRRGSTVGPRGGVVVDDRLADERRACLRHRRGRAPPQTIYGLVAPGYEMADALARNLTGGDATFAGSDVSAKLKLLGIDVASFGDPFQAQDRATGRVVRSRTRSAASTRSSSSHADTRQLLGGILVGDASGYGALLHLTRSRKVLSETLDELGLGGGRQRRPGALPDDAQVCSCNNVATATIRAQDPRRGSSRPSRRSKTCTRAGTGCGGCVPVVTDLLKAELKAAGRAVEAAALRALRLHPAGALPDRRSSGSGRSTPAARRARRGARLRDLQAGGGLDPGQRPQRADPRRSSTRRCRTRTTASSPTSSGTGPTRSSRASPAARSRPTSSSRWATSRRSTASTPRSPAASASTSSAPGRAAPGHLGGAGRRGLRERARLRQGGAHRQELRRLDLVPVRRAGLGRLRHPGREAVQGHPRAAQAEGRRLRLRPRVRRGPEQGLRPDRHREGVEPLRLRQRRRQPAARRPACRRPRRGDRAPIPRPVPHVLHPDGRPAHPDVGLAREDGRGDRAPARRRRATTRSGSRPTSSEQMQQLVETYECEWAGVVRDPEKRALFRQFANDARGDDGIRVGEERGQRRPDGRPRRDPLHEAKIRRLPLLRRQWVRLASVRDVPRRRRSRGPLRRHADRHLPLRVQGRRGTRRRTSARTSGRWCSRGASSATRQARRRSPARFTRRRSTCRPGGACPGESLEIATFPVRVEGDDVWWSCRRWRTCRERLATMRRPPARKT